MTRSQFFAAVAPRSRADCSSMEDCRCKSLIPFLKRFFNLIGSPQKFDTWLASCYPTYMQSFIISHSSCAEQYGDMFSDTQTHSLTHTQLNHQWLVSDKSAIPVKHIFITDVHRCMSVILTNLVLFTLFYGHGAP